jgi:hypothetical protein
MSQLSSFSPCQLNATCSPSGENVGHPSTPRMEVSSTIRGGGRSGDRCRDRITVAMTSPAAAAATRAAPARSQRLRNQNKAAAGSVPGPDPESASRAKATSRADLKRSLGSFSRHLLAMRTRPGASGPVAVTISGGSWLRMALSVSAAVAPSKARRPESIL